MTKTYKQLTHDADMEEFVQDTKIAEERTAPKRRKKKKAAITDDSSRGSFKINQLDKPREDLGFVARRAEKRGDFEEIEEEESNREEGVKEETNELGQMWFTVGQRFGDPLKFVGSPFEKAKEVTKAAEWLEQAQEYMEQMTDVEVEQAQEIEEAVEITREK